MDTYFEPNLYFIVENSSNGHITVLDVLISFVLGVVLLCTLTFTLEKWHREQIKELEDKSSMREFPKINDRSDY